MISNISNTRRNVLLAVVGLLLLFFFWTIRAVLNPLIGAYFLAFVMHPLVCRLQSFGWSRKRAVNTIFLTVGLASGVLVLMLGLQAIQFSREVASEEWRDRQVEKADAFLVKHRESVRWVFDVADVDMAERTPSASGLLADLHAEYARRHQELDGRPASIFAPFGIPLRSVFGSMLALVSFILLLPIYSYFLLFELDRIHNFVRRYIPKRERKRISKVGTQIGEVIGAFFRGRLAVCLAKGAVISIGLAILDVNYALLLGMLAGFMALVPFAGPMLAFLAGFLLALQQPATPTSEELDVFGVLWRTSLVYGVAELLEGYYFTPKILGTSLGLHPVVVLVSIFAGAAAFGMFGALLALPVTSALVILFREFVLPPLARFADEDG